MNLWLFTLHYRIVVGAGLFIFAKNIVLHGLIRYYTLIKIWEIFPKNFKIKVKAFKMCIFCFLEYVKLGLHANLIMHAY